MDDEKLFRSCVNRPRKPCDSRAVLLLLGFEGIQDFARRSDVNHETVGALLGTVKSRFRQQHLIVVKTHEALHTAYMEVKSEMDRPTRAFICAWAKRWQKEVLETRLFVESPGKQKVDPSPSVLMDRKRLQKKVRAAVELAFLALEWTV